MTFIHEKTFIHKKTFIQRERIIGLLGLVFRYLYGCHRELYGLASMFQSTKMYFN